MYLIVKIAQALLLHGIRSITFSQTHHNHVGWIQETDETWMGTQKYPLHCLSMHWGHFLKNLKNRNALDIKASGQVRSV